VDRYYANWLSALSPNLLHEPHSAPLPAEIELQSLWYQGLFGLEFTTVCGQEVSIQHLGEWNRGAGPDFREVLLSLNGTPAKGALELDLTPAHWELHGHATDPNFESVILHLSFGHSGAVSYCRTLNGRHIPQVILSPEQIATGLSGRRSSQEVNSLPGFCAEEFAQWSQADLIRLLRSSARHRLAQKARLLSRQIEAIGLNETLWQGLATTLGYRPNAQSMRLLSQRLPAAHLKNLGSERARLAALLGLCDFLSPSLYHQAPVQNHSYIQDLWEEWWKLRTSLELTPERQIQWQMHGQRPVNHPHRRIASLALLWPKLASILDVMKTPSPARLRSLGQELGQISDPFWSHHYTLTSSPTARNLSLMGPDKFRELLSNFLIPIWYLQDQEAAFEFFTTLRSKQPNEEVKRASQRLLPNHPALSDLTKFTYQHQGLQQLYRDFCLRHGCLNCPFPKIPHE